MSEGVREGCMEAWLELRLQNKQECTDAMREVKWSEVQFIICIEQSLWSSCCGKSRLNWSSLSSWLSVWQWDSDSIGADSDRDSDSDSDTKW
jgi:hypothetical protein